MSEAKLVESLEEGGLSRRDVLLSGGDPLLLSDSKLEHLLQRLRAIPDVEFIRIGSRSTTRRNISGAKFGMPVNVSRSPSVSVSPMLIVPWLCRPMMSPA